MLAPMRLTCTAQIERNAPDSQDVARFILVLRGQRVVLDANLPALYGVATKRFNEQVKRNRRRFPGDFKARARRTSEPALCVHGTWRTNGRHCSQQLDSLERRLERKLATHDEAITAILSAIRELMQRPPVKRRGIGFTAEGNGDA